MEELSEYSYKLEIINYLQLHPNTTLKQLRDKFTENEENKKMFGSAWASLMKDRKISFTVDTQIVSLI